LPRVLRVFLPERLSVFLFWLRFSVLVLVAAFAAV
jgi:hypothetical protein